MVDIVIGFDIAIVLSWRALGAFMRKSLVVGVKELEFQLWHSSALLLGWRKNIDRFRIYLFIYFLF